MAHAAKPPNSPVLQEKWEVGSPKLTPSKVVSSGCRLFFYHAIKSTTFILEIIPVKVIYLMV